MDARANNPISYFIFGMGGNNILEWDTQRNHINLVSEGSCRICVGIFSKEWGDANTPSSDKSNN